AMPLTRVRALGGAFGPTGAEYLLNAASSPYQHGNGEEWIADWRHVGNSSLIQTGSSIDGTVEDDLYRSARIGNLFGYRLELPAGDYLLQLHFADWTATSAGERVFDVFVEGLLAINDIDLVAAGGTASAHVESLEVAVNDGILNLDLVGNIGVATISAVEVRSIPRVAAAPNLIDFAVVEQGQFDQRDVVLTNTGLHEAVLDRLSFDLDAGGFGSGLDFSVEIDGQVYAGANQTIEHAIELTIPAGSNRSVSVLFEPTAHIEHELQLRFEGELGSTEVRLSGLGGAGGGWGYLHPIALVDPALLVDYDADGSESVHLTAEASHTHENGHQIVAYEWSDASGVLSTQAEFDYVATAATQSLTLEIFDDHVPALSATLLIELIMHPRETVPGVLVHIFDAEGGNPADWLDALPAQPHYTERGEYLLVRSSSGSIGGSPYAAGVLVQLAADFQVDATDTYEFEMSGGADSRLDIDGQVLQGSGTLGLTLVPGTYRLDARYAVDHISELPLACDVRVGGQPAPSFADGLRYDASEAVPVLHNMDSQGSTAGGQLVSLLGFGFYPAAEVTVEWGQLSLGGGSPLLLESVEPGMIQLRTPPGDAAIAGGASTGTIAVRVTTPAGSSHSFDFEYLPEGPVDIQFALQPTLTVPVSEPTALLWGPDGRLWVGAMTGELTAITYDAQWNATQVDTYSGVSSLTNPEILGLAFDPWQPGGPLQITVSHNLLAQFNNGPPTGPADYTGQVSTIAGPDFDNPVSLIKRLPVSNHDHGVNAVVYDNNGDLLIAVGGCTNAGVPHSLFGFLSDSPLSGAILKARTSSPSFQGALSYRNRSDDIENNDLVFGETVYLAPGSDVEIHTPGIRNAFDLCLATWGYLYAADNGPNEGYGFGSTGLTTDDGIQASTQFDELNLIERDNWYGYANRNRGFDDARQYVYQGENVLSQAEVHTGPIGLGASSANGLIEYRSDTFGGALRGQLLAQKYFGRIKRHQLSSDRRDAVLGNSDLPVMPALNLEMGPGGVIIATHYLGNVIKLMTPVDASANGATVYDITPWRALAAGGDAFVIGGVNLGSMATTSVTIGGLPATLSSVSSTRIHGTIPSNPAPTQDLVHVVVTVNGLPRTHHNSFMWLPNAKGQWLGTWRESASLLQALGSVSAGVSDKWLLAVGDSVPNTYAYDLLSGGWTGNRAPRPFPTSQHSAHVVAGKLLLFGGTGASQGKVQIYDPVADSWSLGTDMPWTGRAVASAFQGGMVYVMGGLVGSQTVGDHALYDPATDMWTPLPAMDAGLEVCFAAGGSDGHYVYVIGGRAGDGSPAHGFDFVQRYDPATSSWDTSEDAGSVLAPMPKGRSGTGSALWYQNELCIFGGETSDTDNDPDATVDGVYPQVQCWNPGTGVWRNEALMPTARHGTSPVLFQGRAFLVGGGVENGSSNSTTVEVFDRQ
ncbi:MAG: glucose/arabinose dehydrogenase, partial [Planctomycetota bacterium]